MCTMHYVSSNRICKALDSIFFDKIYNQKTGKDHLFFMFLCKKTFPGNMLHTNFCCLNIYTYK